MSYEAAAAILVGVLPWYTWLWSRQMMPERDLGQWLGFWGLRLLSAIFIGAGVVIARRWADVNDASTSTMAVFNALVIIVISLVAAATGLFILFSMYKTLVWAKEQAFRSRYVKGR